MNILLALILMCCSVEGRIQIRQTGSSTVYPFAVKIAREFSRKRVHICPFVESTATGSGFEAFSQSHNGFGYDVINASRPINPKELAKCKESGMASILEVCIGHDGIAFAAKKNLTGFSALRLKDILAAVAKKITNNNGDIVDNPYHQYPMAHEMLLKRWLCVVMRLELGPSCEKLMIMKLLMVTIYCLIF